MLREFEMNNDLDSFYECFVTGQETRINPFSQRFFSKIGFSRWLSEMLRIRCILNLKTIVGKDNKTTGFIFAYDTAWSDFHSHICILINGNIENKDIENYINNLCSVNRLRKVFAEIPGSSLSLQSLLLSSGFEQEMIFKEYCYIDGKNEDVAVFGKEIPSSFS